ncbi:MAG: hypothetical protein IPI67_12305 [Myxococcales bacterium]|nr:hypothetical protein [Myxococcales bacterium]
MWSRLRDDGRARRLSLALAVYALTTGVFFACAARQTLTEHTAFNHFALLAESWLKGRLDLGGPPPLYAQNNDFAEHAGKWFIVFPPFPAVLLLPLVKLGGSAVRVQDGQFFIWLAGIAPAALFLALEKLRRMGLTGRGTWTSLTLSFLFAFGSVYFFTAEQGTVWFAAHVVGAAIAALYVLVALDAERPMLAGLLLGLGFLTRAPLLYAAPLFLLEALRVSSGSTQPSDESGGRLQRFIGRWRARVAGVDWRRFAVLAFSFGAPLACVLAVAAWYNRARFGDPFEFGYRYLTVLWRPRMEKWGLFNFHYLGKNLGVVLTSLPWIAKAPADPRFQINAHGLALWVTTPLYLWLLWPRKWSRVHTALLVTALLCAVPTLFYQNTGWVQFGYRFSNDYSVFLFCSFAIGGFRLGPLFWSTAVWSIVINCFGALTFQRPKFAKYYHQEGTQTVMYQPD